MTKYSLTERQKNMLCSIAPGLEDGKVDTTWSVHHLIGNPTIQIMQRNNELQLPEIWKQANDGDIDDFVEAGLFRHKGNASYTL